MSEATEPFDQDDENRETRGPTTVAPVGSSTTPPAAEEQRSNTRKYVILHVVQPGTYKEIGVKEASSGEAAIRALGEKGLVDGAEYKAVPERNWTSIKAAVKTTTSITLTGS